MPTLIERTKELGARIEAYKALLRDAASVKELASRTAEISGLRESLASLVKCRQLLSAHKVALTRVPKPSAALMNKPASLLQLFTNDPLSLTREDAKFGPSFKSPLQEFVARFQAGLLQRW